MKRFKQFQEQQKFDNHLDVFLEFCMEQLELNDLPDIILIDNKKLAVENRSFGGYHPGEYTIKVNIAERHRADVFRTLAHELVHYKQHLEDRLDEGSGETGSDIENEANAMAGIIMRNFAKASEGNIFEEEEQDGEMLTEAGHLPTMMINLHSIAKSTGMTDKSSNLGKYNRGGSGPPRGIGPMTKKRNADIAKAQGSDQGAWVADWSRTTQDRVDSVLKKNAGKSNVEKIMRKIGATWEPLSEARRRPTPSWKDAPAIAAKMKANPELSKVHYAKPTRTAGYNYTVHPPNGGVKYDLYPGKK